MVKAPRREPTTTDAVSLTIGNIWIKVRKIGENLDTTGDKFDEMEDKMDKVCDKLEKFKKMQDKLDKKIDELMMILFLIASSKYYSYFRSLHDCI